MIRHKIIHKFKQIEHFTSKFCSQRSKNAWIRSHIQTHGTYVFACFFCILCFFFLFSIHFERFEVQIFFFGSPTKTTTNRNKVIYLVFPLLLYNCLSKIDMHNKKIITIQYACPRQIKYTYTQTLFFRGLEAHSVTIFKCSKIN